MLARKLAAQQAAGRDVAKQVEALSAKQDELQRSASDRAQKLAAAAAEAASLGAERDRLRTQLQTSTAAASDLQAQLVGAKQEASRLQADNRRPPDARCRRSRSQAGTATARVTSRPRGSAISRLPAGARSRR